MAKSQLASFGRIAAAALFVYDTSPEAHRTTMISLTWRNELHKEAVRQRVREKALMESAYAVVVVNTEGRTLVISGKTSTNVPLSASVDYAYQKDERVVSRWELQWLDKPVTDFFLEGVFDKAPSSSSVEVTLP